MKPTHTCPEHGAKACQEAHSECPIFDSEKTRQTDSHKKSLSEALVNSSGGYPIAYGLGIVILPLSVGWVEEDPLTANLVITSVYASVSFARIYFLRRVFEKFGVDDNFIRLIIKGIKKLRKK